MTTASRLPLSSIRAALVIALVLRIVHVVPAIDGEFDVQTSPQPDGYLTTARCRVGVTDTTGIGIEFLNQLQNDFTSLDGTELSTVASEAERSELSFVMSRNPVSTPLIRQIFAGISFVYLADRTEATWVQVDDTGEYGTDFVDTRDSWFIAPTIGVELRQSLNQTASVGIGYLGSIAPVYFFRMDQTMTLNNVGTGPSTFENEPSEIGSPYLENTVYLQLSRYLRFNLYHSFQILPYTTLRLADDGLDMVPEDDPTTFTTIRTDADLGVPLGPDLTLYGGIGYEWTRTTRGAAHLSDEEKRKKDETWYFSIGARLFAW